MTEIELVTELRRQIHGRCVRGSLQLTHDHHSPDFPTDYIRTLLSASPRTMLCGGASQWLHHVYQSHGFDSFVMNTGHQDGPSHVVTFVKIQHHGRETWTLQDAYLNMTYVDASGNPLCLKDLYALLSERRFDRIHPSVSRGLAQVLLDRLEEDPQRFDLVTRIAAAQGLELEAHGQGIVHLEWHYDSYPFDQEPSYYDLLRNHFGVESLALLLALPLGTSGEDHAREFEMLAIAVRDALCIKA